LATSDGDEAIRRRFGLPIAARVRAKGAGHCGGRAAVCGRVLFSSHLLCFEHFLFSARSRGNHLVNTGD
jgi:hypothetical protein